MWLKRVTPPRFELGTYGLKVRCSAIELESRNRHTGREATLDSTAYACRLHRDQRTDMSLSSFADNPERMTLAFVVAACVAFLACRVRALSLDGAFAAAAVGTANVAGSGWWCGAALVLYFVTATALSKLRASRSSEIRQHRGNRRDAVQVLANGGVPTLLALIAWSTDSPVWTIGVFCAIAAATADTWATEIGRLTQATPRSITSWKQVAVGTSGAISIPGSAASLLGSLLIAMFASIGIAFGWVGGNSSSVEILAIVFIAGFAGSLLDSFLGGTIQESYRCETCQESTEMRIHNCGSACRRTGGIAGINNDVVNLLSTAVPAMIAAMLLGIAS